MLRSKSPVFLALTTVLLATPVLADTANFGSLTLAPGFSPAKAIVSGSTGGAFSLSSLNNHDIHNQPCIGYGGSKTPDHIITLQKHFSHLKLQVNSGGRDTTLVVEDPSGVFRCGDDVNTHNKDASIDDTNWNAGQYKIWVGTIQPGQRWNYNLSVHE